MAGSSREALVGAAPAVVAHHGHGGRERPVDAGGAHLARDGLADALDQRRVVGGAQADVVREQRAAVDVVVAVDGVGAPDHRHLDAMSVLIEASNQRVGHRQPGVARGVLVHARPGAAAVEHRADVVAAYVVGRDGADVGLRHLADLLGQRHVVDDGADLRLLRGVERGRRLERRAVARSSAASQAAARREGDEGMSSPDVLVRGTDSTGEATLGAIGARVNRAAAPPSPCAASCRPTTAPAARRS